MDKKYEERYHQTEKSTWWFVARRNMVMDLIKSYPKESKILEIGCSSGILLDMFRKAGFSNVQGIDISQEAIHACHAQGINNSSVMDGKSPSFQPESFDLIIASDVLEHIDNDQTAVQNWEKLLCKGGTIICFVPAFMKLWSNHDTINHHFRRYTKKSLVNLFSRQNFTITRSSYWNTALFLPVAIRRLLPDGKVNKNFAVEPTVPGANSLLTGILLSENKLLRYINAPFGVSVFVIVKKQNP